MRHNTTDHPAAAEAVEAATPRQSVPGSSVPTAPRARIAMMVSNPCSPDFRVNKQAESLAKAGYEVRVFCTWKPGLGIPVHEIINGVTYVRREWNPMKLLKMRYLGEREYPQIPVMSRNNHFETAEKYRRKPGQEQQSRQERDRDS